MKKLISFFTLSSVFLLGPSAYADNMNLQREEIFQDAQKQQDRSFFERRRDKARENQAQRWEAKKVIEQEKQQQKEEKKESN